MIYLTLPGAPEHNVRRFRVAILGGGYHGLLVSNRTRVPGLISLYDIAPTVSALERGKKPPIEAEAPMPERFGIFLDLLSDEA